MNEAIHRAYAILKNHRAVARKLHLPLHVVMFTLGLMSEPLFNTVNATPHLTGNDCRMPRRRTAAA